MLVDFDRLRSFTDGDRLLEAELYALFVATAEGYLDTLEASLDRADAWQATAHGLKGAASNIGARAMAEAAAAAEHAPPDAARLLALRSIFSTTRLSLEASLDPAPDGFARH